MQRLCAPSDRQRAECVPKIGGGSPHARRELSRPPLEVSLEARHRLLPERRLTLDPSADCTEPVDARPDEMVPPRDLSRDEPRAFEYLDVFRHGRQRNVEFLRQLRHASSLAKGRFEN